MQSCSLHCVGTQLIIKPSSATKASQETCGMCVCAEWGYRGVCGGIADRREGRAGAREGKRHLFWVSKNTLQPDLKSQ